jgi:hypothetical protein
MRWNPALVAFAITFIDGAQPGSSSTISGSLTWGLSLVRSVRRTDPAIRS